MGVQRYGVKKVRRMAERTGEPITRAWTRDHGSAYIVTRDHRHGVYYFDEGVLRESWVRTFDPYSRRIFICKRGGIIWEHPEAWHFSSCYVEGVLLAELPPWPTS